MKITNKQDLKWTQLNQRIIDCNKCERLRTYCQGIAQEKRKSFMDWEYWGKPVPNFGDSRAEVLIVGLAPAAHGANRTSRMFTGDRSGDWLYRALHKAGFANQPTAVHAEDGLELINCAIAATAHCAPPENKPHYTEVESCREFLTDSFKILPVKVVIALGGIAWDAALREIDALGWRNVAEKKPKFGHGVEFKLADGRLLIGSYHPSQQNTFTGRLTEPMFDSIFSRARKHIEKKALSRTPSKRSKI